MLTLAQLLRSWREQRPSNEGELGFQCHWGRWEKVFHGNGLASVCIFYSITWLLLGFFLNGTSCTVCLFCLITDPMRLCDYQGNRSGRKQQVFRNKHFHSFKHFTVRLNVRSPDTTHNFASCFVPLYVWACRLKDDLYIMIFFFCNDQVRITSFLLPTCIFPSFLYRFQGSHYIQK
jgi:hypothetical protein